MLAALQSQSRKVVLATLQLHVCSRASCKIVSIIKVCGALLSSCKAVTKKLNHPHLDIS
jgi:hypothetical protein